MRTNFSHVADFYHQLALLVRSNLPLPDSLCQLGKQLCAGELREVVLRVGERSASGEKFSDTVRAYPHIFHPFHVRLISAGENSGTLADTLFSVARLSRFQQFVVENVRDILAYPLFTIHIALIIMLYVSIGIMPTFDTMFREMLGAGRSLPALSALVLGGGMFIHDHGMLMLIIYACCLVFSIWIFSPGIPAYRTLTMVLNGMPGARGMVLSMDSARLCDMCSAFLKQGMPLHEATATVSELVQRPEIREALERISDRLQSGSAISASLLSEKSIDGMIVSTFVNSQEEKLADELAELAGLFEHRVVLSVKTLKTAWTAMVMLITSVVVASVVIGIFSPMISIVSLLGE